MIISVIGLGYVGGPLAVELAKHFSVIGFDINKSRVEELLSGFDRTNEITREKLSACSALFTHDEADIADADVYIITVPTPIAEGNVPDLTPVRSATSLVAKYLSKNNIVVFESTVYPGVTEEICVPLLEDSGLKWLQDFNVGYSPERINPGDHIHTLTKTTKIVSADCDESLNKLSAIYGAITDVYSAPSIKVAEGAKVVENIQRDVNIALMNELSQIFNRLSIDTNDVIDAAASKWNFIPFRPGLVGGHCISVDPFYLSHKAATHGFIADVILSSREINDSVPTFIVDQLVKLMVKKRILGADPVVSILGVSFKENVPDIRNSKVIQVAKTLKEYGIEVQLIDPLADNAALEHDYGYQLTEDPKPADAVIFAVPHDVLMDAGIEETLLALTKPDQPIVIMDLKGVLPRSGLAQHLEVWRP